MDNFISLAGEARDFDQAKWISTGQIYPTESEPPEEMRAYYDTVYDIPSDYQNRLIPDNAMNVLDFIQLDLPKTTSAILTYSAKTLFSKESPTEDIQCLTSRNIPSKSFVDNAKAVSGQAMLDGAKSIEDPQYKGGRLPLWTISFWARMHVIREEQEIWKKSREWLDENMDKTGETTTINECWMLLGSLPWNKAVKIPGGGGATVNLASLLADKMLTGDLVDMMLNHLALRLGRDHAASETYEIETLSFMDQINSQWKGRNLKQGIKPSPNLARLEAKMQKSPKTLLFPVHLPDGKHYVGFAINFKDKVICYGDSLEEGLTMTKDYELQKVYRQIQWWLKKSVGSEFKDLGCTMEHGVQRDSTSCAITTVNMIAHQALEDSLWNVSRKIFERIAWFNKLAKWQIALNTPDIHRALAKPGTMSTVIYDEEILENNQGKPAPSSNEPESPHTDDLQIHRTTLTPVHTSPIIHPPHSPSSSELYIMDDRMDVDVDNSLEKEEATSASVINNVINDSDPHLPTKSLEKKEGRGSLKRMLQIGGKKDNGRDNKRQRITAPRDPQLSVGVGASTLASCKLNQKVNNGTFKLNSTKWNNFKEKITFLDRKASFPDPPGAPRSVRHSKCGRIVQMKEPYNIANFETHLKTCRSNKTAGMPTLESLFNKQPKIPEKTVPSPPTKCTVPPQPETCPGLTEVDHPEIPKYLKRSPASGGGAPSLDTIANQLWKKKYSKLSSEQQKKVWSSQRAQLRWYNDAEFVRVFSSSCMKFSHLSKPCDKCRALLDDKRFRQALSVPIPAPENIRFTPKHWINVKAVELWGDIHGIRPLVEAYEKDPKAPCLLYAKGVLSGEYKDDEIFTGLVEAMVTSKEKEKRGVGLQGFKYAPGLKEFAQIINIHSPRAYRALKKILPLPSERSNQINRAREPRFPIGIQDETFERIALHLETLNYNGPLGLACDDTQLLAALRPYYDSNADKHYLLGGTDGPLLLAEPEKIAEVIKQGKIEKATKLRLWCIQVPMPGIPTIIAAAMAISSKLNAENLFDYLKAILDGILRFSKRDLKVIAYAADGSAVERSVQSLLDLSCKTRRILHLKHPRTGKPAISIAIPFYGDTEQPIAILQDSQHGLKTFRNTGYSGARMLILGNFVVQYHQFLRMWAEGGPIFERDVQRVDRQDDSAAIRLFSADVLEWLCDHHPELLGAIVYLFIFGELIDAYQNRHINQIERVRMVLHTLFFLEIWEEFLEEAGYPRAKYFISKEACDIVKYLVHGLIKLIIIYRDHLGMQVYPLLPWLLSTEMCEHVFGICRQILQDFSLVNFYEMIPKLFIRLREFALFGHYSDGKERASGYTHKYQDTRGIDLNALSTFPSDTEMQEVADAAYQEAENLWFMLGYIPSDSSTSGSGKLPSISSWFPTHSDNFIPPARHSDAPGNGHESHDGFDSDYESDVGEDSGEEPLAAGNDENYPVAMELQKAMDQIENFNLSFAVEDKVNTLSYAAIALTINDSLEIHELEEPSEQERDERLKEDREAIQRALDACLPAIIAPEEPRTILDSSESDSIHFAKLTSLRRSHQRKQAATGTRKTRPLAVENQVAIELTRGTHDDSDAAEVQNLGAVESETKQTRKALLREFNAVIKAEEDRGIATAMGRKLRWEQGSNWQPGRKPMPPSESTTSGNSANAQEVAASDAKKVLSKRMKACEKYKLPSDLGTARVNQLSPLTYDSESEGKLTLEKLAANAPLSNGKYYGFVMVNDTVMFAKVLSISSKSGGKNGKHGWVPSVTVIAAASNVGVQLFQQVYRNQFRIFHESPGSPRIKRYALIPSSYFLCTLSNLPKLALGGTLQLSDPDYIFFGRLTSLRQNIISAIKVMKGRVSKKDDEDQNDD